MWHPYTFQVLWNLQIKYCDWHFSLSYSELSFVPRLLTSLKFYKNLEKWVKHRIQTTQSLMLMKLTCTEHYFIIQMPSYKLLFVCLRFSSYSRIKLVVIFIGEGLQILHIYSVIVTIEQGRFYTCYNHRNTRHPFIMVICEDSWHSHLLPSV